MSKLKITTVLSSALVSTAFLAPAAMAQASSEGEQAENKGIVVTGERRDRTLLDTASSVGIVTGEEIEERGLENVADVLAQIPNVSSTFNGQGFNIRGISNSSVTGGGDGNLSTIFIDGLPLGQFSTSFGPADTWDLEQVEVFRGAQSTNQGRNSLAGALVIRSADPVHDTELKGRMRLGLDDDGVNGYTLSAAVNLPIVSDQVALRVAADYRDYDGYIENTTFNTDEFGKDESLLLRAKLLIEPAGAPDMRNLFTVTYTDNDRGDSFVGGPDPFQRISTANIATRNMLEQFAAVWEFDYDFAGPLRLSNTVTYSDADYSEVRDDDRTSFGGVNRRERVNDIRTFTEELRLHYEGDVVNAFGGIYYFSEKEDNNRTIVTGINIPAALPPNLAPFGPFIAPFYADPFLLSSVDNNDRQIENIAGFFNADITLSDLVTLNLGLRYDHENKDYDGGRDVALGSPLPDPASAPGPLQPLIAGINGLLQQAAGSNPEVLDVSYDAWLPQAGLVFSWTNDFTTTLQVKRSYRSGGASVSLLQGQIPFDPESAWTYEAGARLRVMNGDGLLRANVFYMDWSDMQVLETIGADVLVSNAGEATLRGFEIEFSGDASENLSLFANLGFSDTEFTSFTSRTGADFAGNRFPGSSRWTAAAGATWTSGNFFLQGDINHSSSSFANVANTLDLNARTLVNTRLGYQTDNFTVGVFVRNLFDEDYITSIDTANEATFGNVFRIGDPRVFGFEIRATM